MSGSAEHLIIEQFDLLRANLDDTGLALLCSLSMIGPPERKQPEMGQHVADSTRREDILACYSQTIGSLGLWVCAHAGMACDSQNVVRSWFLLYCEEDAGPLIGSHVTSRQGPINRAEPDMVVQNNKVERSHAWSSCTGQCCNAGDHAMAEHVSYHRWVSLHHAPLEGLHNPRQRF